MKNILKKLLTVLALSLCTFVVSAGNQGAANGKPFVEINGQIAEVIDAIDDHIADYDATVRRIDALELDFQGQIDALSGEIAVLDAEAELLRTDITTASDLATQNGTDIAGLTARLAEIDSAIAALEADTTGADNAAAITALEAEDLVIREEIATSSTGLLATVDNLLTNYATADMLNIAVQDLQNQIDTKQDDIIGNCGSGAIKVVNDNGTVQCNFYNPAGDLVRYFRTSSYQDLDRTSYQQSYTYNCGLWSTCTGYRTVITSYGDKNVLVSCASGYQIAGGGFRYWDGNSNLVQVTANHFNGNGWYASFNQTATSNTNGHYGYVYANCLRVN